MMLSRTLTIDFHGYWHAGTGRGSGTHVDALTEKDDQGLPFIAGRHLKGLLRHALRRAADWNWLHDISLPPGPATDLETLLFGTASQSVARHDTLPGLLQVDDARLPAAEADFLAQPDQIPLRQQLYREIYSTAINEQGSAQDKSLRGIEVTLPVRLEGHISLCADASDSDLHTQQQNWLAQPDPWAPLAACLTLIDSLGASRTRGLGEAQVSFQPSKAY